MPIRFGINGFGRIGRALLRAARGREEIALAAVNDVVPAHVLARDFVNDPRSAVVDLPLVQATGSLARVVAWYDNEWGYAHRLADLLERLAPLAPTHS